jgi:hypothetical protein
MGRSRGKERDRAVFEGRRTYFTGKPCKHGHVADRLVRNSECVVCKRSTFLNYQKTSRHLDKAKQYYKNWEKRARAALRALKELGIEI